jgi:HemY protein
VFLTAARVANRIGAEDRRDHYLKLALQQYPKAEFAIALTQAELQLARSQLDQAQTTLTRLRAMAAHHSRVLRLLMQLYVQQQDWEQLRGLLPELRQKQVLDSDQWQRLAVQVYRQRLLALAVKREPEALKSAWKQFPAPVQRDAAVMVAYVQELVRMGAQGQAERVLRERLRQGWNDRFVYIYGDVAAPDSAAQLTLAEGWLDQHPDDAVLLLTLGKISLRNELWGKARSYLEAGVEQGPTPEGYRLLGSLLERMEEPEKAAECYRKGMELVVQGASGGALPAPGQQPDVVALLGRPA